MEGRLYGLDALRGIAALAVLAFHAPLGFASSGYLAVDLFFLLSGFIMSRIYSGRLASGMSVAEFTVRRAARLYPIFLVGALLGALRDGNLLSVFMVPVFADGYLYPGNVALWTLPLEFAASLIFALVLTHQRNGTLIVVTLASGAAWAAFSLDTGAYNLGDIWQTAPGGVFRIMFSFTLGMLIERTAPVARRTYAALPVLCAVGALLLFVPASLNLTLFSVLVLFPLALFALARWELPHPGPWVFLGAISYPLYAIHVPILAIGRMAGFPIWLTLAACVFYAFILHRYYEGPARRLISSIRFRRRSPASPTCE